MIIDHIKYINDWSNLEFLHIFIGGSGMVGEYIQGNFLFGQGLDSLLIHSSIMDTQSTEYGKGLQHSLLSDLNTMWQLTATWHMALHNTPK